MTDPTDQLEAFARRGVTAQKFADAVLAQHGVPRAGWGFIIEGIPRTKKTSSQGVVVQRPGQKPRAMMFPAKEWREWVKTARIVFCDGSTTGAIIAMARDKKRAVLVPEDGNAIGWIPLGSLYNCEALIYLSNRQHGDTLGYLQGLADLLEARRVIDNDRQLVTWDGSRLIHSGATPHIELTLTVVDNGRKAEP